MDVRLPSKIEIARAVEEAEAQDRYWHEHMAELRRKYPSQFVAVYQGRVVKTAESSRLAVRT